MAMIDYGDYLVGGSTYYPNLTNKQSAYSKNVVINDGALVTLPPYFRVNSLTSGRCRCVYYYPLLDTTFVIVGSILYKIIDTNLDNVSIQMIGRVSNDDQAAIMVGNHKEEMLILSDSRLYYYNFSDRVFSEIKVPNCVPCYLSFNTGQFILTDKVNRNWRLSDIAQSTSFPVDASHLIAFADNSRLMAVASNSQSTGALLLLSDKKSQFWTIAQIKVNQFPYFLVSGSDSPYGCHDGATIVQLGDFVIWLTKSDMNRYDIAVSHLKSASVTLFDVDGLSDFLSDNCPNETFRADKFYFYGKNYYVLHLLNKRVSLLMDLQKNWYHVSQDYFFTINRDFIVDDKGVINKIVNNFDDVDYESLVLKQALRITAPVFFQKQQKLKNFRMTINNTRLNSYENNEIILSVSKNGGLDYFGQTRAFLPRLNQTGVTIRKNSLGLCKSFSMRLDLLNWGSISLSEAKLETV